MMIYFFPSKLLKNIFSYLLPVAWKNPQHFSRDSQPPTTHTNKKAPTSIWSLCPEFPLLHYSQPIFIWHLLPEQGMALLSNYVWVFFKNWDWHSCMCNYVNVDIFNFSSNMCFGRSICPFTSILSKLLSTFISEIHCILRRKKYPQVNPSEYMKSWNLLIMQLITLNNQFRTGHKHCDNVGT